MFIIKLARSAKEVIKTFGITDPSTKFLVYKYEPQIPWDKVKSQEDLMKFISEVMIPQLYGKIDPSNPENNYMKKVDVEKEYQQNAQNPEVQRAWAIYNQDPKKAQKQLLDAINRDKQSVFDSWWKYVTAENDIYRDNPAFQYLMLKPMLDMSPANRKNPPFSPNAHAIADIYGQVQEKDGQVFKIEKTYSKVIDKINEEALQQGEKSVATNWYRLPSKINDPENYEKNLKLLRDYSIPNGWCTASANGPIYLSKGDFWLYVEDGIAKVAIRLLADGSIAEIRGKNNRDPLAYWKQIIDVVERENLDQSSSWFKKFVEIKQLNDRLAANDADRANFFESIKSEPLNYEKLNAELRQDPVAKQNVTEGWKNKIARTPNFFDANDIPMQTRKELPEETFTPIREYWERELENAIDNERPIHAWLSRIYRPIPFDVLGDQFKNRLLTEWEKDIDQEAINPDGDHQKLLNVPNALYTLPEARAILGRSIKKIVEEQPWLYSKFAGKSGNVDIKDLVSEADIEQLRTKIPAKIMSVLSEKSFAPHGPDKWLDATSQQMRQDDFFQGDLRQDPNILKALSKAWTRSAAATGMNGMAIFVDSLAKAADAHPEYDYYKDPQIIAIVQNFIAKTIQSNAPLPDIPQFILVDSKTQQIINKSWKEYIFRNKDAFDPRKTSVENIQNSIQLLRLSNCPRAVLEDPEVEQILFQYRRPIQEQEREAPEPTAEPQGEQMEMFLARRKKLIERSAKRNPNWYRRSFDK